MDGESKPREPLSPSSMTVWPTWNLRTHLTKLFHPPQAPKSESPLAFPCHQVSWSPQRMWSGSLHGV